MKILVQPPRKRLQNVTLGYTFTLPVAPTAVRARMVYQTAFATEPGSAEMSP